MTLRRFAAAFAALALTVGLLGYGVSASYSDNGSATQSVHVGTFDIEISSTDPDAVVVNQLSPSVHTVTLPVVDIVSSAAGSKSLPFAIKNIGSIGMTVQVTMTTPLAPFTSLLAAPVADVYLTQNQSHEYLGGLEWPMLVNGDLNKDATITYSATVGEGLPVANAVAPTAVDAPAGGNGAIVIPSAAHIDYAVDGSPVSAGSHPYAPGTYHVTAAAQAGFQIVGYPAGGWTLTINELPSVQFIGATVGAQAASSMALPAAAQPGDLAVVMVTKNATATLPSAPTGYTSWATATGGSGTSQGVSRLAYRILQTGDTTVTLSGGWRAALVLVYRHAQPGVAVGTGGTSTTVTFNALALQQPNGSSWAGTMAWSFNGMGVAAAPAGMTSRTASGGIGGFDTNGGVTAFASRTIPATSQPWNAFSFEVKAQ